MNIDTFTETLNDHLIPRFYKYRDVQRDGLVRSVFRGRDLIVSRYLLTISEFPDNLSLQDHIRQVRDEIKHVYRARWFFTEVGVQIIVYSDGDNIEHDFTSVSADKFGTKAVIIQGIHLVNMNRQTVESHLSRWGLLTFGNGGKIHKLLRSVFALRSKT